MTVWSYSRFPSWMNSLIMYFGVSFYSHYSILNPILVVTRSKAWICCHSFAGIACSNPIGGTEVCLLCCTSSGRSLRHEPIARPEESYRVWCVWVWSRNINSEEDSAHWYYWAIDKTTCRKVLMQKCWSKHTHHSVLLGRTRISFHPRSLLQSYFLLYRIIE